ncbi:substrate-binding domain-containing protein [Aquariibacter albus]|uniref:Helix-turn-helix transcriptional regulator n=1 Tax=Aquariibacter albus TaxID=2759899 RepID=A0A839HIC4_9BURK|nr:substrate-binding domain-containing protein [Aquariibacter albus]MBB1162045.1 helix-turn-helix transcriptional regulator [Aquariibacter albus]
MSLPAPPRVELRLHFGESAADRAAVPPALQHPLFALLAALAAQGSIQQAARGLGLSYRHCWGELRRWEQRLGQALVHWARGQRAVLTPYGGALLQAERLARARLAPQIEQLQDALDAVFDTAATPEAVPLRLAGVADPALARLLALGRREGLALQRLPATPAEALQALARGCCEAVAMHLREGLRREGPTARAWRAALKPGAQKLLLLGQRSLGLMLPPGNPDRVAGLADLDRLPSLRAVDGSAEELALAELRAEAGLPPPPAGEIEPSPEALAEQVVAGRVALAFGPETAARAAGLDFLPLAREHSLLLLPRAALERPAPLRLQALLASPAWAAALAGLPGVSAAGAGRVLPLGRLLPWWPVSALRPAA